jgi:hypothetical protein
MRFVRTATIPMLALSMALLVLHPAAAACDGKSDPVPTWLSQEDLARLSSSIVEGSIACNLGYPGPPLSSIVYIIPPNDQFYTLLRPNGCAACAGANAARLSRIHLVLNFRRPCTIPIQYGIVANAGTDSCPFPNPGAQLCLAQSANLTAATAGAYDFPLTLPDSCKITGPSFLAVNFVTFPPACNNPNIDLLIGTTPMLVLINTCTQCSSFNFFETEQDDLCVEPDQLSGNPMMYAEAFSCYVPTFRRTWGQLKIRYR